jgi:protein-S-isoprenylcysteine O-methyltransferase Ste14
MIDAITIRYGNFIFRYRNLIFPLVLFLLLFAFTPQPAGNNTETDIWMDVFGAIVAISGQVIRITVIGLAYIKRGGLDKQVYAETLVESGIFAHVRNPLYLGNLLIIFGIFLVHNNFWVYLIGGLFFLYSYNAMVRAEENYLQKKFGYEFTVYCNRVGRWTVNLHGLTATFNSMTFDWRRVVAKDYTTMALWILTIMVVIAWGRITHDGLAASSHIIQVTACLTVFVLFLVYLIKWIKKSGYLRENRYQAIP